MAKRKFEDWGGELLYPRSYQKPLIAAIRNKIYDRACCVWHRRAGKDLTVTTKKDWKNTNIPDWIIFRALIKQ